MSAAGCLILMTWQLKLQLQFFTKKREINLPRLMNAGTKLYQLFPALVEKLAGRALMKK